jgi:hypothetical protein
LFLLGRNGLEVPVGIQFLVVLGACSAGIFAWIVGHTAFRCPRCERNIGELAMRRRKRSGNGQLACCPYCGISLDENEAEQPANVGENWHWGSRDIGSQPALSDALKAELGRLSDQCADQESSQGPARAQLVTIRERFNGRKQWLMASLAVCVLLYIFALSVPQISSLPVYVLGLVALGLIVLFAIGSHFAFRCPQCRFSISLLIMRCGKLKVDDELACCPYCGVSLDEKTEAEQPANAGESW